MFLLWIFCSDVFFGTGTRQCYPIRHIFVYNMRMFEIDNEETYQLERALRQMSDRAVPYATRNALNEMAFKTQRLAKANISRGMITRNQWTARSVVVKKAGGLSVARMASEVGSTESYMEKQEFGGVERKKGKHGVPIPTSESAGQNTANPRTRAVRPANWLSRISLARGPSEGTGAGFGRAIDTAQRSGKRYFHFRGTGGKKGGIFKIVRKRRRRRGRAATRARVRMMYNLDNPVVVIPATPWLRPAAVTVLAQADEIYEKALNGQLAFLRRF